MGCPVAAGPQGMPGILAGDRNLAWAAMGALILAVACFLVGLGIGIVIGYSWLGGVSRCPECQQAVWTRRDLRAAKRRAKKLSSFFEDEK